MNRENLNQLLIALLLALLSLAGCVRSQPPTSTSTQSPETPATSSTQGKIIIVNNPADNGTGTLRQALVDAKGGDTITFDAATFPPTAPNIIFVSSKLPPVRQSNLTIDASDAGVIIDGGNLGEFFTSGLEIVSDGNIIRGLQIVNFSGNGITIVGNAQNNIIGGDKNTVTGLLGQGNLTSGNKGSGISIEDGASHNLIMGNYIGTNVTGIEEWGNGCGITLREASYNQVTGNVISGNKGYGIQLFGSSTSYNTISENFIGTDASGEYPLGNQSAGIAVHNGANHNNIGQENVIAYNSGAGIATFDQGSNSNTMTKNRIYSNTIGIGLAQGGNNEIKSPIFELNEFDLEVGAVRGIADADCTIEIFSDDNNQGKVYEGQTKTNDYGEFAFYKNTPFVGPVLTATATDLDGNTSKFSNPLPGINKNVILQDSNTLTKVGIQAKRSKELMDNRIVTGVGNPFRGGEGAAARIFDQLTSLGGKRAIMLLQEGENYQIDWSTPEFYIPPDPDGADDFVAALAENGIIATYVLSFWDKANHPEGWDSPFSSRFKTEEEIQRYLDFVRFIVGHFKGRIQYYQIWELPERGGPPQQIEVVDYINLVKRTVPVIHQEDPEAKIVVGNVYLADPSARDWLFDMLRSDIMPLVDVVSWTAMLGQAPENNSEYWYEYRSIVQKIKDLASAHGFEGEFRGESMTWWSTENPAADSAYPPCSNTAAAKYYARGIVMNLGMDLSTGVGAVHKSRVTSFTTVRNLSTIMAGAKPSNVSINMQSSATNIRTYSFSLPDGSKLVALWTDGIAVDEDPGVKSTVTVQNVSAQKVMGIDVLNSFEQPLKFNIEDSNLIIHDLLVKDYPIFLLLIP